MESPEVMYMINTLWSTSAEFLLFGAHSMEERDLGKTVAQTQKLRMIRQMPVTANTLRKTKNLNRTTRVNNAPIHGIVCWT